MSEASTICGDYGSKRQDGTPCQAHCIRGTHACKRHIGKRLAQAKADGALRKALDEWGIDRNDYIDPADVFLRLIAQSARRVQRYADAISAATEAQGELNAAWQNDRHAIEAAMEMTGHDPALAVLLAPDYAVTKDGERIYIGSKISSLTHLESQERDRLATWCSKAIAAGLEERRVKVAEQQGMHLATVIRLFTEQLGLTAAQREQIPDALRMAVMSVFGTAGVIEGDILE